MCGNVRGCCCEMGVCGGIRRIIVIVAAIGPRWLTRVDLRIILRKGTEWGRVVGEDNGGGYVMSNGGGYVMSNPLIGIE